MRGLRITALRRSIFAKFVVSFMLAGLLPLSALGYFLMNAYFQQSERFNANNLEQMTLYLAKNAGQLMNGYNDISKLMYDVNWYPALSQAARGNQSSVIDNWLSYVIGSDPYIENAYFVPQTSREIWMRSRRAEPAGEGKIPLEELTSELKLRPKEIEISPARAEKGTGRPDRQVITFARNLLDTSTLLEGRPKVLGVFLFDVNVDAFDELIEGLDLGVRDRIVLTDRQGNVVYGNDRALIGREMTAEQAAREADGRGSRVMAQPVNDSGQMLLGTYYRTNFLGTVGRFKGLVIATGAACLALLLLLSLVLSRRFSQPIRAIMQKLSRMESGDLDVSLPVRSQDELGQLTRGMNRMAEQLGRFIQEAYVAELKQKQAELGALKSQIRPHYLYNTLEVIRMSAVSRDDMPVADMIHSLSNQLAYVLDNGENLVTLDEELANVRDYFHLIEARYEDLVSLEIAVGDGVSTEWGVLKLSMQPLLENAVQHGILPKESNGRIRLEVLPEEPGTLAIRVIDDGIGMDEARLAALHRKLEQSEEKRSKPSGGRGLKNVHDRLRALYGERYGLTVDSYPQLGTSVQIRMPIIREFDRDRYSKRLESGRRTSCDRRGGVTWADR
ncbi:cache domain-containing sensor histidine kinase [Cohnella fermenti]|uniref:Sensor histidine kinase n=1 Tax=Cohnella fermenti TaxID=2565925 RepID=A0A4S4BS17_9BACL|nr:sensor histidine kinase [Cohnella fermenti]THF77811.1 sensor histidine kinase [Cohnella fermenti]